MYVKFLFMYSQTSDLLSRKTASVFAEALTCQCSAGCNHSAFVYGRLVKNNQFLQHNFILSYTSKCLVTSESRNRQFLSRSRKLSFPHPVRPQTPYTA